MSEFHLLRPGWLLVLLPVALLYWRLLFSQKHQAGWHQWLPGHLSRVLVNSAHQTSSAPIHRVMIMTLIGVAALSGPTWERLPQPVYQLESGQVVVMDMSPSVLAEDITPNRLTRMRYKAIDLVRSGLDGDTGLIAYADDAFIISPLTADNRNLINLIPSLSPDIMPAPGSEPLLALKLADELLKNAGYAQGDIYWLTDGISSRDLGPLTQYLRSTEHRVSILATGTEKGAPVRDSSGRLLKNNDAIVLAKMYPNRLQDLANLTHGVFTRITADNQDIHALVHQSPLSREGKDSKQQQQGDDWRDMGPYLALLMLPLMLFNWRRGTLLTPLLIMMLIPLFSYSPAALAAQEPTWTDRFLNQEQRAQRLYEQKHYKQAAELSTEPLRRGASLYQSGDYAGAAEAFAESNTAEAAYNQGNALAQQQAYDEAISAYNRALEKRPNWQEAKENKQWVEQAKQQQAQQQSSQQDNGSDDADGAGGSDQSKESQPSDSTEQSSNAENQTSDSPSESQQTPRNRDENEPPRNADTDRNEKPSSSRSEQNKDDSESEQLDTQPERHDNASQANQPSDSQVNDETRKTLQQKVAKGELDPEKAQQLEQWMNRVPDDPSILLRNKMLLESQRRRQRRASEPQGEQKKW